MKILVFPYELVMCGTVVNAIDLAVALRDSFGHEVVLFATPGPMLKVAEQKRLRFVPAPPASFHPSPARVRALREVVRRERPDIIHAWDWYQCLEAFLVEHLCHGMPVVATDMQMTLEGLLPKSLPTTYGTPELVDKARASGYRRPFLLLPPVDIRENGPDAVDPAPFRRRHGPQGNGIILVTVSRLDTCLKRESLFRTVEAVRTLGRDLPLHLVIVGDGEVRADLERAAASVNCELGRPAVVFTGQLLDPRPAYSAADIVIGMGGSALRGLAFRKPVIIVGEGGFAEPFTPQTADDFYYKGMYGIDNNTRKMALVNAIRYLAENPHQLPLLGEFSRQFILKHFSLETVSSGLSAILEAAVASPRRFPVAATDGLRTAAVWLRQRRFMPHSWNTALKTLAGGARKPSESG
jgi:glycosyltransferase involved in cell wall biosynthesis